MSHQESRLRLPRKVREVGAIAVECRRRPRRPCAIHHAMPDSAPQDRRETSESARHVTEFMRHRTQNERPLQIARLNGEKIEKPVGKTILNGTERRKKVGRVTRIMPRRNGLREGCVASALYRTQALLRGNRSAIFRGFLKKIVQLILKFFRATHQGGANPR